MIAAGYDFPPFFLVTFTLQKDKKTIKDIFRNQKGWGGLSFDFRAF